MSTGQDGSCPRRGGRDSLVGGPEDNHPQIAAPLRTLRASSAHSHLLRGPAYVVQLSQTSFLGPPSEKKILKFGLISAYFSPSTGTPIYRASRRAVSCFYILSRSFSPLRFFRSEVVATGCLEISYFTKTTPSVLIKML